MNLDHAGSSRLNQRPAPSTPNILRVATDADRPENPSHGLVAYVEDTGKSHIWNAAANAGDGAWEPFGGGVEFYAQADPPTTAGYAAFWLDTSP